MSLPGFPTLTEEALQLIAERHDTKSIERLPILGMFNAIYGLGDDLILRIPRDAPWPFSKAHKEAVVVPVARQAGVRTPAIVTFDGTRELIPAPYTVYERVRGDTLELLYLEPQHTPDVWRDLGRDLARLHAVTKRKGDLAEVEVAQHPDPRVIVSELAEKGSFTVLEARWLLSWLEHLAPAVQNVTEQHLLHGDAQAMNIMVNDTRRYRAIIDRGSARWGDAATDLANVPFHAVPFMLEGYREVRLFEQDDTAEARILWRNLGSALDNLRGPPQPDWSWAERPLTMVLQLLRFLVETEDARWRQWLK